MLWQLCWLELLLSCVCIKHAAPLLLCYVTPSLRLGLLHTHRTNWQPV